MKRFKLIALLVLSLGVGCLSGIAWSRHDFHKRMRKMAEGGPMPLDHMERRLVRALDLNEEQSRKIHEKMEARRGEWKKIREEMRVETQKQARDFMQSLREVLNPEQKKRLEEIMSRFEKRRPRREGGRHGLPPMGDFDGPPPPPPGADEIGF